MTTRETVTESLERGGRVLLTRLQYLGDVVLTLPVLQILRERFPRIRVDYLTKAPGADLLAGDPRLEMIHRLGGDGPGETIRLVRALRGRRYALAIDFLANPRSAILTRLSGARVRVGGTRRGRRHLYTHQVAVPGSVREATGYHLYHLQAIGIPAGDLKPVLPLHPEERERARSVLATLAPGGESGAGVRVGIHPGGKWEVKRWPAEYFARLADTLSKDLNASVYVIAGPGEERYVRDLLSHATCGVTVVPVQPVRMVAALIDSLDCMVVGDGGIMHIAVAVGTPTVGIFGSSEPDIWFPYERHGPYYAAVAPVACRPCHSHTCDHLSCLRELSVATVADLVADALARRGKDG